MGTAEVKYLLHIVSPYPRRLGSVILVVHQGHSTVWCRDLSQVPARRWWGQSLSAGAGSTAWASTSWPQRKNSNMYSLVQNATSAFAGQGPNS